MRSEDVDVLVLGAGPAGVAAARAARRGGASVTVVDENTLPGGQIFRQPLTAEAERLWAGDRRAARARGRAATLQDEGVRHLSGTVVWGAAPGRRVLVSHDEFGSWELRAAAIIVATGAYERPVPFPGWTLPGVMTSGGAQAFLKGQGVCPGQIFLLAGSGPLQFALAAQLIKAGAHVEAIVDTTRPTSRSTVKTLPGLLSGSRVLLEGAGLGKALLGARVPIIWGAAIRRALGSARVEGVEIGRVDDNWRPTGPGREFSVDTVCVGYGFVPSVEIVTLLGCDLYWNEAVGGWVPVRDRRLQTSQPHVYAAGDGAGIAGSTCSEVEGELAGLAAAVALGHARVEGKLARRMLTLQSTLRRLHRFGRAIGALMTPKRGVSSWLAEDTVVCRCEEVTAHDLRVAVDEGACGLRTMKLRTRAGMGRCQGRMCGPAVTTLQRDHATEPPSAPAEPPRPQIPIKPIECRQLG